MRIDGVRLESGYSTGSRSGNPDRIQSTEGPRPHEVNGDDNLGMKSEASAIDPNEGADAVIDDKMLNKALNSANNNLKNFDRVIERSVHEKTRIVMYVIKDTKTNEVIAEFPPKKIEDMIAKMWELAGMFVDEKA